MGNPKQKWSQEEEECLRAAVAKHGTGIWKTIKNDPEFSHLLDSRSNIDLKDKWRNMSVSANGQGLKGKSGTPKSKGNTNCRATQAEIAETPDSLSLPVVDQVSTDVHISDASKCVLDDKIASKHQSFSDMDIDDHDIDEEEFEFSRNYFLAKESGKSGKKSARKLSEIDIVDEQDLRAEVSNIEQKHEKEIASLINSYKSLYDEWVFELRYGFGLLLYGFGSKKTLIEDFASTALTEYSVIVVNGYLQSINIKQVAMTMAEVLWDQLKSQPGSASGGLLKSQQPFNSRSMDDLISFLDGPHAPESECFVCLVIHNIDGPGLRDSDSQNILARIAACSHVRVVASIDHVNAPLLWDKKMVHVQFNWCWHHVPTFAPYKVEGVFHPLILAHGGASQSVKTAVIVLQSLTPNAQSVFKVLAEHQLAHPDEEGMPIDALFTSCRERFLVSSLVTLNSHLTEFKDHELVKIRRHSDGQDCFYIPLSKDALEKLVPEINQ